MIQYAIFARPVVTIYDLPAETMPGPGNTIRSAIGDEGLYGQTCRVLAQPATGDFYEIVTFYGYHGYVHAAELLFMGEGALRSHLSKKFALTCRTTDVLSIPAVQGVLLAQLPRGAKLELLPEKAEGQHFSVLPAHKEGWQRVRLLDGTAGYVWQQSLAPVRYNEGSVFYLNGSTTVNAAVAKANGIPEAQLVQQALDRWHGGSEAVFRAAVMVTARQYLRTQYRWGGKSNWGLDCSGLVSMCYLQNGVIIYRDAKIVEGWPMHAIPREAMQPGDALYFPGHIALYLGNGEYIHSTGAAASGGVVINSLDPAEPHYRKDLDEGLTAVGTIF